MTARPALFALAAIWAAPSVATGQNGTAIVTRAGRAYRALTSLQASFVQIIEDRAQGDTLVSRGTVTQGGTNFFAMRFDDPPGEAIVVDGKYIWTYLPSTSPMEVTRTAIPTDPVYGVNLLAKLLDRPEDRYQVVYVKQDTASGHTADVLDLVPTSEGASFKRARIWLAVDDALPRRIELEEGFGARRILILSRLRPNAPTSRATFTFERPSGVKVVDRS